LENREVRGEPVIRPTRFSIKYVETINVDLAVAGLSLFERHFRQAGFKVNDQATKTHSESKQGIS
jgi:hypothetical protein